MSSIFAKSSVYVTRISPTRTGTIADFKKFREEIELYGAGVWDKDAKNRMTVGDYWAVILGEKNSEKVEFYRVVMDLQDTLRPSHWESANPYNTGNGVIGAGGRHVIRLKKVPDVPQMPWTVFKSVAQWSQGCSSWMPRGTTRCKKGADILQLLLNPLAYFSAVGTLQTSRWF